MSQPPARVLILAPPSILEPEEEEPPQEWFEIWDKSVAPGDPGAGLDLVVAFPDTCVRTLREWRDQCPDVGVVSVSGAVEDETRLHAFFGDEGVYFLNAPPDRGALRSGIREVLSYCRATNALRDEGQAPPELSESCPVAGWFELTAPSHPVFLRRFRAWMDTIEDLPIEPSERRRLLHAVREVGWNAIEWGNGFDASRRLTLSALILESGILFRVQDEGGRGDWYADQCGDRDAAEIQAHRSAVGLRPGGLGLRLVERIVDRIEVSSNGNIVILEKHFAPVRSRES